jgi:acyl-CoA dehydrogenase
MIAKAHAVARIAAEHAADVDVQARFPQEAFEALRTERLLGIMIPAAHGGEQASLATIAEIGSVLAQGCSSTGMIYAMHQIKVSSLVVHCGEDAWHRGFMARIAEEQLLLASATTEGGGVGGDLRSSVCGVVRDGEDFTLEKEGCLISYGAQADSHPDHRPPHARSAALGPGHVRGDARPVPAGAKRRLGHDGHAWHLFGQFHLCRPRPGAADHPHALCRDRRAIDAGACASALGRRLVRDRRRSRRPRRELRAQRGAQAPRHDTASALRLAELLARLQQFKALIVAGLDRYERARDDADELSSMGFVVAMNSIKIAASQSVVEIVSQAFLICGIQGYRNDSPSSLTRLMRDALSAPIMINNDRILGNTSNLLAVYKHDSSLSR